ncbi:MAG: hypothetical protein ACOYN0_02325 [Phycisphaerales bacterium]
MPGALFITGSFVLAAGALVWLGYELKGRQSGRASCRGCDYDMTGVDSLTCPECGRAHASPRELVRANRSLRRLGLAALVAVAGLAGAASPIYSNASPWAATPTRLLIAVWPTAERLGWTQAAAIAEELRSRRYSPSQLAALQRTLVGILADSSVNEQDRLASGWLLGLSRLGPGVVRWDQDLEPDLSRLDDRDDEHPFVSLGPAAAPLVPPLLIAAKQLRGEEAAPVTLLSLLSRESPEACDALIELLDQDVDADEALAARGGELGATRLLDAFESSRLRPPAVLRALAVLDRIGSSSERRIGVLIRVATKGGEAAVGASNMLARQRLDRAAVLPRTGELIDAVQRASPETVREVLSALRPVVAALDAVDLAQAAPMLESADPDIRIRGAALFSLASEPPDFGELLEDAMGAASEHARVLAYEAVLRREAWNSFFIESAKRDCVAAEGPLADSSRELLAAALPVEEFVEFWRQTLAHPRWEARELACESLARIGARAVPAVEGLRTAQSDPEPWVAQAASRAVRTLTRTSPPSPVEQLTDEIAIARRRARPLEPVFARHLQSIDPRSQVAAIERIAELLDAGESLRTETYVSFGFSNDSLTALVLRLMEIDRPAAAAEVIASCVSGPWATDRSGALADAIASLTPEQAAALRDPLVSRLRGARGSLRAKEIIGAVEAMSGQAK